MEKRPEEHRNFWRIVFHSPATFTAASGTRQARLLDISLKGALLDVGGGWHGAIGEPCELKLHLGIDTNISMSGTIAHVEGNHIGLRCDNIDLDSITHLRRLVELNVGDPELLEREFHALAGGH